MPKKYFWNNNSKTTFSLPAAACLTHKINALLAGLFAVSLPMVSLKAADLPIVLRDQNGAVVKFQGANIPGQPYNNQYGGKTLSIEQFSERATLHWESFDIADKNEVKFKQPSTSSIALNRVMGDTSVIHGRLTANGRIYLINQNGILFGPNAKINTHSLVASALDIDDKIFNDLDIGIVNAFNETESAAFDSFGEPLGDIAIEAGAEINSAKNGRIMVFAPNIKNEGTITSEEGQIVLAAAQDKVYIASAEEGNDLRGLLVEVNTGGDVNNLGTLIADRGNVSLLGLSVNQNGMARATTSVSLNGSIRLLAQDSVLVTPGSDSTLPSFKPVNTGELTLGSNSITEVLPDDGEISTALDAQTQALSKVTLVGNTVDIESDAQVSVAGGIVDIDAVSTLDPNVFVPSSAVEPAVNIKNGALIDVSGDDQAQVSVARNYVQVEARGNELADSPLQRDGAIRNKTLTVDIREGTEFLNADGAIAAVQRGVNERLSVGGEINIESQDISLAEGATLDFSGGLVTYTGANVASSQLITLNGRVVDIADADPNAIYQGVLDDLVLVNNKWGQRQEFKSPFNRYEPGYIEGRDAGRLTLKGANIDLEGSLVGGITAGQFQRFAPTDMVGLQAFQRSHLQRPLGGELILGLDDTRRPDVVIGGAADQLPALNGHPLSEVQSVVFAPELLMGSGISRVTLNHTGRVIINRPLQLSAFGELDVTGTQVLVQSDVKIPGGQVILSTDNPIADELKEQIDQSALVSVDATIDVSGTWSNDSLAVNEQPPITPVITQGGLIQMGSVAGDDAIVEIALGPNSVLDVSGGAYLDDGGSFEGGAGGSIALLSSGSGQFPSRLGIQGDLIGFGMRAGGNLMLAADAFRIAPATEPLSENFALRGAEQFRLTSVDAPVENQILVVNADTFQLGGFQSYELRSSRNLFVAPDVELSSGAELNLTAATPVLSAAGILPGISQGISPNSGSIAFNNHPAELVPSHESLDHFTRLEVLPDFERTPVNLSLRASRRLLVESNATINAEPGAAILLQAGDRLLVDGMVSAPAGSIDLIAGSSGFDSIIRLGSNAQLLAPGWVKRNPVSENEFVSGVVLDAGRVSLFQEQGSIVAEPGASINVDAAAGLLNTGTGGAAQALVISGDAGEVAFTVASSLLYQGTLSARSAGQQAGRLSVTLDPRTRDNAEGPLPNSGNARFPRGPHTVVMADYNGLLPGETDMLDPGLRNTAFVPLGELEAGGFDALDVKVRSSAFAFNTPDTLDSLPIIEFRDDLTLDLNRGITLDTAVIQTVSSPRIALNAPYIALGSSDTRVRLDGSIPSKTSDTNIQNNSSILSLDATPGEGQLRVNGRLIELVGELVTQGFGGTNENPGISLYAEQDVRARGVRVFNSNRYDGLFRTSGDLEIHADRLYPTTLTEFELTAQGADSAIHIASEDPNPSAPLSVGGALTLNADTIVQSGTLQAPLGTLSLNATSDLKLLEGSLTSTSSAAVAAPFFQTQPGGDLVLPSEQTGESQIVFVEAIENPEFERLLPQQQIELISPQVVVQAGATFDIRGGGAIRATEFQPGPGGSRDILLPDSDPGSGTEANPSFAIIPGMGAFAPFDPLETPAAETAQGLNIGDTVVLEEGIAGILPAGEYALLPPRYALFGGYLITPVSGSQDLSAGLGGRRQDGAPVLAGRYAVAGTHTADSRTLGFAVEDGVAVRNRADYLETALQDVYTGLASRRPQDAGTLSIEANSALQLAGQLVASTAIEGMGSQVDIVADQIAIQTQADSEAGIVLLTDQLRALGADSLLIGGRRSFTSNGLKISPIAQNVTVSEGVDLALPELILVADQINIGSESVTGRQTRLQSDAAALAGERENLVLAGNSLDGFNGNAAVLAVSNRDLTLARSTQSGGAAGEFLVGPGVTLRAHGSVVADAVGNARLQGTIDAQGAAVSLGGSSISMGETEGLNLSSGLVLSNTALGGLTGSDLRLRSESSISIFGDLRDASDQVIAFQRMQMDAQGLIGVDNQNKTVSLATETLALGNSTETDLPTGESTLNGSGLNLITRTLELNGGVFALQGYEGVSVMAGNAVFMAGNGHLRAEADLSLNTPVISAVAGADSAIVAADSALIVNGGQAEAEIPVNTGLAASLMLKGDSVDFGGRVVLPSGTVEIQQTASSSSLGENKLTIADGAIIDVSGITRNFGEKLVGTPGGRIRLRAESGPVTIGSGQFVVSPSLLESNAGVVEIHSPENLLSISSDATFVSGNRGGEFVIDANRLQLGSESGERAYTDLNLLLGGHDFNQLRDVRLRDQDILFDRVTDESGQDFTLRAHQIRLISDKGNVIVRGTIDASGDTGQPLNSDGGRIVIAAGDSVEVESSAVLLATAAKDESNSVPLTDSKGGRVELFALDSDGSDVSGVDDKVHLRSGALIDVSGGVNADFPEAQRIVTARQELGGSVVVHTRRLDSDQDGQTDQLVLGDMLSTVQGAAETAVVATRVVKEGDVIGPDSTDANVGVVFDVDRDLEMDGVADSASITTADILALQAEVKTFLQNTPTSIGDFQVEPGIVIESSSSLVLEDVWDFDTRDVEGNKVWGDTPGHLTLRSQQQLLLQADLTDAFFDEVVGSGFFATTFSDQLRGEILELDADGNTLKQIPRSWGFRIVSGADATSADLAAVVAGEGDVRLGQDVVLRTGTENIEVIAGNNVVLDEGSAIYTGGYDLGLSQNVADVLPSTGILDANFNFNRWLGAGSNFSVNGGDITVSAAGNIEALGEQTTPTEWLPRIGEADIENSELAGAVPTHWGIAFSRFTDGIGALGGGRVDVRAGADLVNVSVANPTTGRAIAGAVEDPVIQDTYAPALETTEISGGGVMRAVVGGDIKGGSFHLGDGNADISVNGEVTRSTTDKATVIYTGGDAQFRLTAGAGTDIGGISDPNVMPLSESQASLDSILTVSRLENQFFTYSESASVNLRTLSGDQVFSSASVGFSNGVAPDFRAVSFSGDLTLESNFTQYPSPSGQLELLAYNNLLGTGGSTLQQSDQDSTLQRTIDLPSSAGSSVPDHALVPVHLNDERANLLVAEQGSIKAGRGTSDFWAIVLAKKSRFEAGTDIENLGVVVQNINPGDITTFEAGRDIVQSTQRDSTGRFIAPSASTSSVQQQIKITGPGTAQFMAGRQIALGTSLGIESVGNAENPVLPDSGADLLLIAGIGESPAYSAFIQQYLVDGKTITDSEGVSSTLSYTDQLDAFLSERGITAPNGDAVETFLSLGLDQQRQFVSQMFFNELRESGVAAQTTDSSDFSRGFEAIETLFPTNNPAGGISMLLSQVQTLDGGNVDMLVPGGLINAGAANADIIQKEAADLGIVTARPGDINIFVDSDFLVNSTRAFALQGDLLVWSSNGSIDAGRGAKTVRSIPDPVTRIDENGQTVIEFPPAVEGSGLQGQNAFLFAPRGVINAGDAGIRTIGNLTISAVEVVGADNIDVGGVSIGVPVATAGVGASIAGASSAATSATSDATEAATVAASDDEAVDNSPLGILAVQVVGFGECPANNPTCN